MGFKPRSGRTCFASGAEGPALEGPVGGETMSRHTFTSIADTTSSGASSVTTLRIAACSPSPGMGRRTTQRCRSSRALQAVVTTTSFSRNMTRAPLRTAGCPWCAPCKFSASQAMTERGKCRRGCGRRQTPHPHVFCLDVETHVLLCCSSGSFAMRYGGHATQGWCVFDADGN